MLIADLQYVLQEAGASLDTQFAVCSVHTTLRRFQAIADDRAGSRAAASTDFGISADTPAGRQQTAAIVASWELAKEISSKEIELRAEARGTQSATHFADARAAGNDSRSLHCIWQA